MLLVFDDVHAGFDFLNRVRQYLAANAGVVHLFDTVRGMCQEMKQISVIGQQEYSGSIEVQTADGI